MNLDDDPVIWLWNWNWESRATYVKRLGPFIVIRHSTSAQLHATSSRQPATPPPSPVWCATGGLHQSWRSCNQNGKIMKNGSCQSGVPRRAGCRWALARDRSSTLSEAFDLRTRDAILNCGLKWVFFCSASFSLMNSVLLAEEFNLGSQENDFTLSSPQQ